MTSNTLKLFNHQLAISVLNTPHLYEPPAKPPKNPPSSFCRGSAAGAGIFRPPHAAGGGGLYLFCINYDEGGGRIRPLMALGGRGVKWKSETNVFERICRNRGWNGERRIMKHSIALNSMQVEI